MNLLNFFLFSGIFLISAFSALADYRPGLLFREDWAESPPEIPVNQDHVVHPDLILGLHGPGRDVIKKSNHDKPVDDPFYIWSGLCEGNWMVSLTPRNSLMDLTGHAKIRWRSKQAGFRQLRIVLELEDGTWLVSDASDGPSQDWRVKEFNVMDIRWRRLNLEDIRETRWAEDPDLSRVKSVGFTDLMRGGRSAACSRLDWIEVYGNKVEP